MPAKQHDLASITFGHTQRWYPGADAPAVPTGRARQRAARRGRDRRRRPARAWRRVPPGDGLAVAVRGDVVHVITDPKHVHVFSGETRLRIGD